VAITTLTTYAFCQPDGHVLADTKFESESEAWIVGLGWPSAEEILDARRRGYSVRVVELKIDFDRRTT
jgi:hypothetical protein